VNITHIVILFLLILLVCLDLLTSASRSAYRSVTRARLLQYHEDQEKQVSRMLDILKKLTRALASLHLFQAFTRFLIAGGVLYLLFWGRVDVPIYWFIGVLLVTALLLATFEWYVSSWAAYNAEKWALGTVWFTRLLLLILAPFVSIALAVIQESPDMREGPGTVEEEVKTLVDAGQQGGELEQEERKMIYSIFQLGDTLTREIMVPRIDMLALDVKTSMSESVDVFNSSGFSRVPVYDGTIDNILGVLYAKDLLKAWREENHERKNIRSLLRKAYFVPEAKKVDDLLTELQSRHVHLAIVIDEYGGVAGLVTLEDIIEEIFGEIQDEYDEEEQPYLVLDNGDYIFQGKVDLDDFNEVMNCDLSKEEADTVSGFIYRSLGHVPSAGESVRANGLLLIVEQVSNRRIKKVRAQRIPIEREEDVDR